MLICYHSGLEGYCKASAELLDLPRDTKGWLPFCCELLPDRTEKTISRTWKISNERNGRGSRQRVFENCWLEHNVDTYHNEAELLCKGKHPLEGFLTIQANTDYEHNLLSCHSKEERKQCAIRHMEDLAVKACVASIMNTMQSANEQVASVLASLLTLPDAPVKFYVNVLSAIEDGFVAERYQPSEARQFSMTINGLVENAQHELMSDGSSRQYLKGLLKALVAGLIYGPSHPLAIGKESSATLGYNSRVQAPIVQSLVIRVTQVYDKDARSEGYSEIYDPDQVVFLGRSSDPKKFIKRCEDAFGADNDIMKQIHTSRAVLFPICDAHACVSGTHGMLLCAEGVWRFYDLESTYGTTLWSKESDVRIGGTMEVKPGDMLKLGAPQGTAKDNVFWTGAVVRISCYIDREREQC